MARKSSKTTLRYRHAGTGRFLTDRKGENLPKNRVVRERVPKPGHSDTR